MWKMFEWKKTEWLNECQLSLVEVYEDKTSKVIKVPSEMDVLRRYYNDSDRLDVIFPYQIQSYKKHIVPDRRLLDTASIVYFHGKPKPHQIMYKQWVQENWR